MHWDFWGVVMLLLGANSLLMALGVIPMPIKAWDKEADRQTTRRILPLGGAALVVMGIFELLK